MNKPSPSARMTSSSTLQRAIYRFDDMPVAVYDAWISLRSANPALYSPYFHPDYTALAARHLNDVNVAVLSDQDGIIGVMPFQGDRFARPAAAPMTDYHGVICASDKPVTVSDLFAGTSVRAFRYDGLVSAPDPKAKAVDAETAVIRFGAGGPREWRSRQGKSFTKHQANIRRRFRKAALELGPAKFEPYVRDHDVLDTLIDWKIGQYRQEKFYNIFKVDWTRALLHSLLDQDKNDSVHLDLHTLSFGDHLVAIDTGLSDGITYHRWIVGYDHMFGNISPGMQILNFIIDGSGTQPDVSLGYQIIDHGPSAGGYKEHYATDPMIVMSGYTAVAGSPPVSHRLFDTAERFGREHLRDAPGRLRRRYAQIAACENGMGTAQISLVKSIVEQFSSRAPH